MSALLDDVDLVDRILAHADAEVDGQGHVGVARADRELQLRRALRRRAGGAASRADGLLPFGGLAGAGLAYIARTTVGTPLLVVRGLDGIVRGFRNACRHRGMKPRGR